MARGKSLCLCGDFLLDRDESRYFGHTRQRCRSWSFADVRPIEPIKVVQPDRPALAPQSWRSCRRRATPRDQLGWHQFSLVPRSPLLNSGLNQANLKCLPRLRPAVWLRSIEVCSRRETQAAILRCPSDSQCPARGPRRHSISSARESPTCLQRSCRQPRPGRSSSGRGATADSESVVSDGIREDQYTGRVGTREPPRREAMTRPAALNPAPAAVLGPSAYRPLRRS